METQIITSFSLIALQKDIMNWCIKYEHDYDVLSICTSNLPKQYVATITYIDGK